MKIEVYCDKCDKKFLKHKCEMKENNFCSRSCAAKYNRNKKLILVAIAVVAVVLVLCVLNENKTVYRLTTDVRENIGIQSPSSPSSNSSVGLLSASTTGASSSSMVLPSSVTSTGTDSASAGVVRKELEKLFKSYN